MTAAMTEPRGRSARWNAALLLVPGAAALFGGAVAWAANTSPAAMTSTTSHQPAAAAPSPDRAAGAHVDALRQQLEKQIAAHRRNSVRLERVLASLRAKAARADRGLVVAMPAGPVDGYAGGGSNAQIAAAAPAPAPAPVQAPAPAPPPPPVHANTGASGHP